MSLILFNILQGFLKTSSLKEPKDSFVVILVDSDMSVISPQYLEQLIGSLGIGI